MATMNQVQDLFDRLRPLGFNQGFLRRMLPAWWSDAAQESPSAMLELKLQLARQLGLDVSGLMRDDAKPTFALASQTKFKRTRQADIAELSCAASVSAAAAKMVAAAVRQEYQAIPKNPREIRNSILKSGARWVSLKALAKYCWDNGIPVLHASQFPEGNKKMDGMVMDVDGRPVIILNKLSKKSAWQLFILAHELGHIANGHLGNGEVLVDEDLEDVSLRQDQTDKDEVEADKFALEVLSGDPNIRFRPSGIPSARALAHAAMDEGKKSNIDAGHIILNYGMANNAWAIANKALDLIEPNGDAPKLINAWLFAQLDIEVLPKDSVSFLHIITNYQERHEG